MLPFPEIEIQKQLELHEGKRSKVYKDTVGKLTVGIGRNISDIPFSDDEIALMFSNDIKRSMHDLDQIAKWWRDLDSVRQRVLLDMCFNLGATRLSGFVNTLKAIQQGRYEDAAKGMEQSKWYSQVGNRAKRLVEMMRTGRLPSELMD